MKGAIPSLPGTHPACLPGGNGFRVVFPANELVFSGSNLKVSLLAPKRGLEVEDWSGGFGLMCPAWCLSGAPTAGAWSAGVPVLNLSQECGLLSGLWLKPVVGRAMGAVTCRKFGGALG